MEKVKNLLVQVLAEVLYLAGGGFILLFLAKYFNLSGLANLPAGGIASVAVIFCGLGFILRKR